MIASWKVLSLSFSLSLSRSSRARNRGTGVCGVIKLSNKIALLGVSLLGDSQRAVRKFVSNVNRL